MARSLISLEREIRELDASDQEELLRVLIEGLDGPPDEGVEAAWLHEIERRSVELESGAVEAIPAEQVFAEIDALLKK
jgi:putative addiction module component (TIGR02574 family)